MKKTTDWRITFTGSLFEIQQNDKGWEKAVRAPGVRLVLDDKKTSKILLTREFRSELSDYDYRLPGGKVFDTLAEFDSFRNSGESVLTPATDKAIAEAREEAGYEICDPQYYDTSVIGATVEWDLLVFTVTDFTKLESGQELEDGEEIETDLWFSYDEIQQMIMDKKMQEDRVAMILLRYLDEKRR